ncbi:hypothetical protein B0G69_1995 [Paraburkholderia sp. RAU2J]|uniref:hypothetical protein n=1 Tax=Paraburkholderia sp. RAU2J TaxID=1938810 RepID=UPI000EB54388|nr:hypothetical protein [Paraburkholderia sp. RAU2J]RKT26257.1 hypothetical protein B0G69_1995 [Paraburkholderia sp. RAU2J]
MWQVHVLALGVLAASLPAFANTVSDNNIVWSVKPAATASARPECTAYPGRQVSDANEATSDPLATTLKVAGTLAALAAFSAATKATSVNGPNPCRRF